MSARNFKFKSPGARIEEIDQTFDESPSLSDVGPVIIGRSPHGPSMKPVQCDSRDEFIRIFGQPSPGGVADTDQWRSENRTSAHYGAYAALSYLKNAAPITFIRLAGLEHENATTAGQAGWRTEKAPSATIESNGGAYGLWLMPSGSGISHTGSLAAVFYMDSGSGVVLSDGTTTKNNTLLEYSGAPKAAELKLLLTSSAASGKNEITSKTFSFNLDPASPQFIRKVFNTSPVLANSALYNKPEKYWLGETFEINVAMSSSAKTLAFVSALGKDSTSYKSLYNIPFQSPKTGWVFSQDLEASSSFDPLVAGTRPQQLFRLCGLDEGRWASKNLKISIADINYTKVDDDANPYPTFSVQVRKSGDSDKSPKILESFDNCNLNPRSLDFISRKIGDQYLEWNDADGKMQLIGDYENRSQYIRVELDQDLNSGKVAEGLVPFGFMGPARRKSFSFVSGSAFDSSGSLCTLTSTYGNPGVTGISASFAYSASVSWPDYLLRVSASNASPAKPQNAYFGIRTEHGETSQYFSNAYADLTYPLGNGHDSWEADSTIPTVHNFAFSLDDVRQVSGSTTGWLDDAFYEKGSRKAGNSITAKANYYKTEGSAVAAPASRYTGTGWKVILDSGFNKFTMPLHGGFDGVNIKEKNPFANKNLSSANEGQDKYAHFSVLQALKMIKDPEFLDFDVACIPGVWDSGLNTKLADYCQDRKDALAIIDLDTGFAPQEEVKDNEYNAKTKRGSVQTAITNRQALSSIYHSYAATYYPWLKMNDSATNSMVDVPPSVPVLGVLGYTSANSEPWFAPAGFTRAALDGGDITGYKITSTKDNLNITDRNELQENQINPIASFPRAGIVIYAQKTMQIKKSALDRINVRRLMIFLKREIALISSRILFEQNVQETWKNFVEEAEPVLAEVKDGLGLTSFKLVLDKNTTTDDLIDQNMVYAKIFVKPSRAIEKIAIDFILTPTGVEFPE